MEQNANALPKVTLGQYKGLEFTLCTGGKVRRARDARHAGF